MVWLAWSLRWLWQLHVASAFLFFLPLVMVQVMEAPVHNLPAGSRPDLVRFDACQDVPTPWVVLCFLTSLDRCHIVTRKNLARPGRRPGGSQTLPCQKRNLEVTCATRRPVRASERLQRASRAPPAISGPTSRSGRPETPQQTLSPHRPAGATFIPPNALSFAQVRFWRLLGIHDAFPPVILAKRSVLGNSGLVAF